jgi:uncharacterized membrane protein
MGMPANTPKYLFWLLNALLGAALVGELLSPRSSAGLDAAAIVLAAAASIAALSRRLPLQNVLLAALLAALIGGGAHGLSSNRDFSMPFGPVVFNPASGAKIFHAVPWTVPLLWIIAIFNARGLARLILRPWCGVKNHGFWLLGLTAALAVAFDVALEPFAWHVKHFWLWQPTKIAVTWQGAALLNFPGWLFVSLLILAFATPALIKKQPGAPDAPDFHPLALWLGALLLFAAGSAGARLWWSVGMDAAIAAVTAVLAVRGAGRRCRLQQVSPA